MLRGFSRIEQLAAAINEPGLGVAPLRDIERRARKPTDLQLQAIANACGVPVGFLTLSDEDLNAALGEGELEREVNALRRRIAAIEEQLRAPGQD